MTDKPKVTFGFVNCNRLLYLKSCLKSLLVTTEDFLDKELIIVDNASVEEGTEEYLQELESQGFTVVRQTFRDFSNEFARGLNTICRLAKGDFIVPLHGDMQFVLKGGWLSEYVRFAETYPELVGSIVLNAQRRITNDSHVFAQISGEKTDYRFLIDFCRDPVSGAGNVFYSRSVIEKIFPWCENNRQHEGGQDSETAMLAKVRQIMAVEALSWHAFQPIIPPAITIDTDPRGTHGRVRGNRRYGAYWGPKEDDYRYYELIDFEVAKAVYRDRDRPVCIEELAKPVGFEPFLDENGCWLKNPIRPETAQPGDWVDLPTTQIISADDPEILEWMNS